MTIHTDFRRGTPLLVMFKDRRPHSRGRFTMSRSGYLYLDGVRIKLSDVRSVTIDRKGSKEDPSP